MDRGVQRVVIVCVTALAIAIVAGIVSISLGTGDPGRAATVVSIIGGIFATTLAALKLLAGLDQLNERTDQLNDKADRALNGEMDKKIKAATLAALKEHAEATKG